MRMALDARPIFNARRSDDPRGAWLTQLYSHLHDARPDWQLLAYHRPIESPFDDSSAQLVDEKSSFKFAPTSLTSRPINLLSDRMQAWARLRLPFAAWRDQADVVHNTLLSASSAPGVPSLVTIDHLMPIEAPCGFTAKQVATFEQRVRNVCRRADHIVVPTEHLRTQLVIRFQAEPQQVSVIAPGVNPKVHHVTAEHWQRTMLRYGLNRPFVLHYGHDVPQRNTRKLIEAWAMADSRIRRRMQLLIVGLDDASGAEIVAIVNRLGLGQSVRLMREFAEPGDLSTLLSAADITAMPSKAVGFPSFLLEAWKARSAVITGKVSGMETLAGDAATLVDPADPCAIARALKRLVTDARFRSHLIAHGQQRLQSFSWSAAAERFAQLAERLAKVPSREVVVEAPQRQAA